MKKNLQYKVKMIRSDDVSIKVKTYVGKCTYLWVHTSFCEDHGVSRLN